MIPDEIETIEELGLADLRSPSSPDSPAASCSSQGRPVAGKSTTLAAMIDEINRTRTEHILTIEDPIEFVHRHKRCGRQPARGRGRRAGFAAALRAALRQDPT